MDCIPLDRFDLPDKQTIAVKIPSTDNQVPRLDFLCAAHSLDRTHVPKPKQLRALSAFHSGHKAHILPRVKSPRSKPTPNWKQAVLASPDWPDDLVVPQNDSLPEESEAIQDSMSTKDNWEWELWRHPEGHCYYLKVWSIDEGDFGNVSTPGAELTVMEAFQFLLSNWMPRDVIADLTFERPDLVKPFELPPGGPGLN
jgi:hypothetical protein